MQQREGVPDDAGLGASRAYEAQADGIARELMKRAGYNGVEKAAGALFGCSAIKAEAVSTHTHPSYGDRWVNQARAETLERRAASLRKMLAPATQVSATSGHEVFDGASIKSGTAVEAVAAQTPYKPSRSIAQYDARGRLRSRMPVLGLPPPPAPPLAAYLDISNLPASQLAVVFERVGRGLRVRVVPRIRVATYYEDDDYVTYVAAQACGLSEGDLTLQEAARRGSQKLLSGLAAWWPKP